jgi:hypothetical protein
MHEVIPVPSSQVADLDGVDTAGTLNATQLRSRIGMVFRS